MKVYLVSYISDDGEYPIYGIDKAFLSYVKAEQYIDNMDSHYLDGYRPVARSWDNIHFIRVDTNPEDYGEDLVKRWELYDKEGFYKCSIEFYIDELVVEE